VGMAKKTDMADSTRYSSLPVVLRAFVLVGTAVGIFYAAYFILGFSIGGYTFLNAGYYYLLYALFGSTAFLILPARKGTKTLPWYDLVLAGLTFGICVYFHLNAGKIVLQGWLPPSPLNFALALTLLFLILEGARRVAGPIYFAVCLVIAIYPMIASYAPGLFEGASQSPTRTIGAYVFGGEGILGLPARVLWDILIGFLVFAGLLIGTGAGRFFTELALALLGRYRGGSAKVAVVSSGLLGMLSGSSTSNVVTIGAFTIPAMKRMGFAPEYAGAVEACASTGGPLLPPVMGATAFIMCSILRIPYSSVIVAAAIPAILYYFGLLMQVDAYAARVGLKGLPREGLPSLRGTLKWGWPFIAVLFFLVWGLVYMRWEYVTPFYASVLLVLLSFFSRETMMTPKRFLGAVAEIGKLLTQIAIIILPIGIIVSALVQTGLSGAIAGASAGLGEGNAWLLLLLGAVLCYVFGMAGVMVIYIFLAVTVAPTIISSGGLDPLAVHLFLIYYTELAVITPPVAAAAFIGAGIAGAPPMKTAWTAMKLGIVLYFVPFMFVFRPALILHGSLLESIYLLILCFLGISLIAGGLQGYMWKVGKLEWWSRLLFIIAGILVTWPDWALSLIGAGLTLAALVAIKLRQRLGRAVGRS